MCGIVGAHHYGSARADDFAAGVKTACERMRNRGPDHTAIWTDAHKRVAFGHTRLAIIAPGQSGAQPMLDATARYAITFNGEIYNYRTLRSELELQGYRFKTRSDTEVILNLFAAEGPHACRKLQGMYAFAIYDTVDRSLFLARDPYGIKPLYFADQGNVVRFASQVKALLAQGGLDDRLDPAGLVGFSLLGHVPEPFTIYRGIRALPAGHYLKVSNGKLGHCTPLASIGTEFATPQVYDERADEICRDALRDSIARHLEADVDTGVFLSGGVDSGAVLGVMRDHGGARHIPAITLAFDDLAGTLADEAPLASMMARKYGADHTIRRISKEELQLSLEAIKTDMDQPTIDGVNTWLVARVARKVGLKAVLSGIGGDELLGGYSTFQSIPATVKATRWSASFPGFGAFARKVGSTTLPFLGRTNPKALCAFELGGSYPGAYLLRRGVFMPHELPALLGADLAREGLQRLNPFHSIGNALRPDPLHSHLRVAALESANYLRNQLLRDADWAGMAHGVEIRTPFVDFQLLQTMAPHLANFSNGKGKALLSRTPSRPLPDLVLQRPRCGFSVPLAAALNGPKPQSNRLVSRLWARHILASLLGEPKAMAA